MFHGLECHTPVPPPEEPWLPRGWLIVRRPQRADVTGGRGPLLRLALRGWRRRLTHRPRPAHGSSRFAGVAGGDWVASLPAVVRPSLGIRPNFHLHQSRAIAQYDPGGGVAFGIGQSGQSSESDPGCSCASYSLHPLSGLPFFSSQSSRPRMPPVAKGNATVRAAVVQIDRVGIRCDGVAAGKNERYRRRRSVHTLLRG